MAGQDLPRTLGLLDATVSESLILAVWIFSGVLSFFGALA